jgi:hypothetical protein
LFTSFPMRRLNNMYSNLFSPPLILSFPPSIFLLFLEHACLSSPSSPTKSQLYLHKSLSNLHVLFDRAVPMASIHFLTSANKLMYFLSALFSSNSFSTNWAFWFFFFNYNIVGVLIHAPQSRQCSL